MIDLDYKSNYDILQLLARRMKEYRLAARLSQRELAGKSGVSYTPSAVLSKVSIQIYR